VRLYEHSIIGVETTTLDDLERPLCSRHKTCIFRSPLHENASGRKCSACTLVRTLRQNDCGIARFPCGSTSFLYITATMLILRSVFHSDAVAAVGRNSCAVGISLQPVGCRSSLRLLVFDKCAKTSDARSPG